MQLNITQGRLIDLDNEIGQYSMMAIGILLNGRIQEWRKNTHLRVSTVRKKMMELQEKYLVIEKGQVQFSEEKDERGNLKPKMKDGLLFVSFQKEMEELFAITVAVNV